jgi:hypothetical protein
MRSVAGQSPLAASFLFVLGFLVACGKDEQPATAAGQASSPVGRPGTFTTPAANPGKVGIQPDSERTAWAVLSGDGGTITATAADGTRFVLTLPKGALLGPEDIRLTPVASLSGLPASASSVAAAQLEPDGLLLLKPATLEIRPSKPLDRATAFPVAWSASGDDLHLHPLMPHAGGIRFQVMHFSGFAIANGSDAAMNEILQREPQQCGERYFREIAEALKEARRAALMGEEGGISKVIEQFVQISKGYLADVLQPIIAQLSKDETILPCVRSELGSFERTFRLMAGDSLAQALFAKPLEDGWMEVYKASAAAFVRASDRCKRKESPIFQFQLMTSASRFLSNASLEEILPADWAARVEDCGKSLEYRVGIESTIENTYRGEGRANYFSSSKTTAKVSGIRVVYNPERSTSAGTPTFMSLKKAPLDVTVTAVPRYPCPDKVRVQPGSYMEVTITTISNPRVGRLICGGGKVRCESSDLNPGVMVQLGPQVVEEMYVHTKTSAGCMPPEGWNEYMMFFQGSQSTGAFEEFQVRGNQSADTTVRRGTRKRGYVDVPDIERSISRTRTSLEVVR